MTKPDEWELDEMAEYHRQLAEEEPEEQPTSEELQRMQRRCLRLFRCDHPRTRAMRSLTAAEKAFLDFLAATFVESMAKGGQPCL